MGRVSFRSDGKQNGQELCLIFLRRSRMKTVILFPVVLGALLSGPLFGTSVDWEIHGVNCKDLAVIYQGRLQKTKGVQSASIQHVPGKSARFRVQYDASAQSEEKLKNWLRRNGMQMKEETFTDPVAGVGAASQPGFRTWTDVEGRELKARMLSVTETTVVIQTPNSFTYTLPWSKFSENDQAFLKESLPKPAAASKVDRTSELIVSVRELMCDGAKKHITAIYGKVPGVTRVEVLFTNRAKAEGDAKVTFDPSKTDRKAVISDLKKVSYILKVK